MERGSESMRKEGNAFSNEYSKQSIVQVVAANFKFNLTPRFLSHYRDNGTHYEPYSIKVFLKYCTEGAFVIDVGAHYGFYSLNAAKAVGKTGKVVSCEPITFNKFVLDKNIRDNHFDETITSLRTAVSNRVGTADFNITEASDNASFYDHPNTKILETVKVKSTTLDNLVKGMRPSIIKIDVEGHENEVLAGASEILGKKIPIFFEFNPKCFDAAGHKPEEVLTTLKRAGYKLFLLDDKKSKMHRLYSVFQWRLYMKKLEYKNILAVH
jgi:FkbM family methyltransferase